MVLPQIVTAIYENGVLTPLEKVKLRKRQKVRVKITPLAPHKQKTVARPSSKPTRAETVKLASESFGMWADRDDIGDAVEWVNEIRAGWEERLKEIYKDT